MADDIDQVKAAATSTMQEYAAGPLLVGLDWVALPVPAIPVFANSSRFVVKLVSAQHQRADELEDRMISVKPRAASRLLPSQSIAFISYFVLAAVYDEVQRTFVADAHRNYKRDPRSGLIALSRISSM